MCSQERSKMTRLQQNQYAPLAENKIDNHDDRRSNNTNKLKDKNNDKAMRTKRNR